MTNKSPHLKIYLNLGWLILTALLLIFIVLLPSLNKIKQASQAQSAANLAIRDLYRDWLALQASEKNMQTIDLVRLDKSFLNPDRPLDFILTLEDIIQRTNLQHEIQVSTFSISPSEKIKSLPFHLTVIGSFNNLMDFLQYFENMPYYAEIENFQLKKLSAEEALRERTLSAQTGDFKAIMNIQVITY